MLIQYIKPEMITARFHHRTQLQSQCPCNYTGLISDSIISSFLALKGTLILVKFHNISLSKWKRFKGRKGVYKKREQWPYGCSLFHFRNNSFFPDLRLGRNGQRGGSKQVSRYWESVAIARNTLKEKECHEHTKF